LGISPEMEDMQAAVMTASIIILPWIARLIVACIEQRLKVIEAKLDRNTALTMRAVTEVKSHDTAMKTRRQRQRAEDPPADVANPLEAEPRDQERFDR
jgi:hypothetical protein